MASCVRFRRVRNVIALAMLVCLLGAFCLLVPFYFADMTATAAYVRVRWGASPSADNCIKIALSDRYYPLVVEAMKKGEVRDALDRKRILHAIKHFRPGEYEAFLWAIKNDPDADVRDYCLGVVSNAVFEHPEFMVAIIAAVDDPDDKVVCSARRQLRLLTGVELVDWKEVRPPPGAREKWEKWWAEHKDNLVWDGEHQRLRVAEEETPEQL